MVLDLKIIPGNGNAAHCLTEVKWHGFGWALTGGFFGGHDMTSKKSEMESTKQLMAALVRMKPKPHEEMKVGKKTAAKKRSKKLKSKT